MKTTFAFFILFLLVVSTGKTQNCTPTLDSVAVVKTLREKKAYHDQSCKSAQFNAATCEWTVKLFDISYTHKGACKRLNGCTRVTTTTLVIDDKTQKVKNRSKKSELFPHYE